jgi:hypothetical protein
MTGDEEYWLISRSTAWLRSSAGQESGGWKISELEKSAPQPGSSKPPLLQGQRRTCISS